MSGQKKAAPAFAGTAPLMMARNTPEPSIIARSLRSWGANASEDNCQSGFGAAVTFNKSFKICNSFFVSQHNLYRLSFRSVLGLTLRVCKRPYVRLLWHKHLSKKLQCLGDCGVDPNCTDAFTLAVPDSPVKHIAASVQFRKSFGDDCLIRVRPAHPVTVAHVGIPDARGLPYCNKHRECFRRKGEFGHKFPFQLGRRQFSGAGVPHV